MTAKIILEDDNGDQWETDVEPGKVISVEDYFIPCVCGRVVLMGVASNSAEGCHVCKEEQMKEMQNDPKQIKDWLEAWEWDYEHPGYWVHTKPYGRIMVGEYIGFYVGDPGQHGNQPFLTVEYSEYEKSHVLADLRSKNLIDDDDERHIRMAIRYEQLVQAPTEISVWIIEGGELHCPDSMRVFHKRDADRFIEIPAVILNKRPLEEWDADDHAYLNGLAEHIKKYLDSHFS